MFCENVERRAVTDSSRRSSSCSGRSRRRRRLARRRLRERGGALAGRRVGRDDGRAERRCGFGVVSTGAGDAAKLENCDCERLAVTGRRVELRENLAARLVALPVGAATPARAISMLWLCACAIRSASSSESRTVAPTAAPAAGGAVVVRRADRRRRAPWRARTRLARSGNVLRSSCDSVGKKSCERVSLRRPIARRAVGAHGRCRARGRRFLRISPPLLIQVRGTRGPSCPGRSRRRTSR